MKQQYDENSRFCFYEVDKIASGSSCKTLKLWEVYDSIFMNVSMLAKISSCKYRNGYVANL